MIDAIQHVDNQKGRLDLLCSLLPVLINKGKSRTTSKVIKLISSDLESIKRFPWEPEVLCNLAESLILLGKAQDASKLVNSALSKAESHAYPGYRAFYLSKISELLAHLGEKDRIPEIAVRVLENTDWNFCEVGWSKEAKIRVSIALTRIGRTDVLEHIVLMADKSNDEELKSDILCGIAASLSPNRLNQLDFLVMSIKSFKEEKYTLEVLNTLIESLARMEKKDELNKLLIVAQEISSENEKIRAFSELTRHLTNMNCYQDALLIWKERLQPTYLKNPQDAFTLLEENTLLIAQIDKGRTLKSLYEIIVELREW